MSYEIEQVDVWAGEIENHPGELAGKLEGLRDAGANLEFVIVRPVADPSNEGVLYVAPVQGAAQAAAAEQAGLHRSSSIHALRVRGPDRPGLIAELARALGSHDINITGLSAAVIPPGIVLYLRFEFQREREAAREVLRAALP